MPTKFFITISKFNRGSMTPEEINAVHDIFINEYGKLFERFIMVNEHKNHKGEDFEHVHFLACFIKELVHDTFQRNLKKIFKDIVQHTKDMVVKSTVPDEAQLVAGYFMKVDDTTIIDNIGFTDEIIEEYKKHVKVNKELYGKFKNGSTVKKISKTDLPFFMKSFIEDNDIYYDTSPQKFAFILRKIFQAGYDFEIKGKIAECKAKLDLLFDNEFSFEEMIETELRDIRKDPKLEDNYEPELGYQLIPKNKST